MIKNIGQTLPICSSTLTYPHHSSNADVGLTLVTSSSSALQSSIIMCGYVILSLPLSLREISNWQPEQAEAASSWAGVPRQRPFEALREEVIH